MLDDSPHVLHGQNNGLLQGTWNFEVVRAITAEIRCRAETERPRDRRQG